MNGKVCGFYQHLIVKWKHAEIAMKIYEEDTRAYLINKSANLEYLEELVKGLSN